MMKKMVLAITCFFVVAVCAATATRDVWTWPFSKYSIWNMPIGSSATYVACQMPKPDTYCADVNYVHVNTSANPRTVTDNAGNSIAVDDGQWVDVNSSENKVLTVFESNRINFRSIQPGDRASATGNFNGWMWMGGSSHSTNMTTIEMRGQSQSIYGWGIEGAHWGAGMSGFGGTLRIGELVNTTPIHHALALEVSGWKYMYYDDNDNSWDINTNDFTQKGFRWPADRNDSYANGGYKGTVPAFRVGALLAIKATQDLTTIGLTTDAAKKIAWTLQNYGGYVIDDAYGVNSNSTIFNMTYEEGVDEEFRAKYNYDFNIHWSTGSPRNQPFFQDMDKIIPLLHVISNNGPKSVGGGGNPRECLAPNFSSGTTDPITTNPNGNVTLPSGCNGTAVVDELHRYPHQKSYGERQAEPSAFYTMRGKKITGLRNGRMQAGKGVMIAKSKTGSNFIVVATK